MDGRGSEGQGTREETPHDAVENEVEGEKELWWNLLAENYLARRSWLGKGGLERTPRTSASITLLGSSKPKREERAAAHSPVKRVVVLVGLAGT